MAWSWREVECEYCGRHFNPKVNGPTPKWCSGACRQAAYRLRNRLVGFKGELHQRRRRAEAAELAARSHS